MCILPVASSERLGSYWRHPVWDASTGHQRSPGAGFPQHPCPRQGCMRGSSVLRLLEAVWFVLWPLSSFLVSCCYDKCWQVGSVAGLLQKTPGGVWLAVPPGCESAQESEVSQRLWEWGSPASGLLGSYLSGDMEPPGQVPSPREAVGSPQPARPATH